MSVKPLQHDVVANALAKKCGLLPKRLRFSDPRHRLQEKSIHLTPPSLQAASVSCAIWRRFLLRAGLLQALLQHGNQIDYFGRLGRFLWFLFNFFPAGFHFLFDHFHKRFAIVVLVLFRIPFRAHAVDERFGHVHLAFADLGFFRDMQLPWVREFIGEMHQLEDERAIFWFYPGEILARLDDHFGDTNLAAVL